MRTGTSMIDALEIFKNPDDLIITVGREKEGDKFSIGIFRGGGHNFKPLLTSTPCAENMEDAIQAIKRTLETVQQIGAKEFAEIDQSKVLNTDLIARIVDELRQHKVANTYTILVPTS